MNAMAKAGSAGAAGSITTTVLHQLVRGATKKAPRADLLGMQALSGMLEAAGIRGPKGRSLYTTTIAADLICNAAYFSPAAIAQNPLLTGTLLGLAAGVGAVLLPGPMGLSPETTSRTPETAVLSILLYTAGGVAAGLTAAAMKDA